MKKYILTILLFFISLIVNIYGDETKMIDLIPKQIDGWKLNGDDEIYNRDTIFKYMNGAGEVYRLYAFRELLVRRFIKDNDKISPEITIEIFDMTSSSDAFGIFSHNQEGETINIGQDAEYDAGFLRFWKGHFFVSIWTMEESEMTKSAIIELGKTIANNIKSNDKRPVIIDYLPQENLIKKSIRYFHNHISLNYHHFVANENILSLNEQTEAVLANYKESDCKPVILLINYPNKEQASIALNNFKKNYLASNDNIVQTENNKFTGIKAKDKLLMIIFDAPTKEYIDLKT